MLKSDPNKQKEWKEKSAKAYQAKRLADRKSKDEKAKSKAIEGKTSGAKRKGSADAPSRAMLDNVWSEVVRLRAANECQLWNMAPHRCHEQVDAHHIIGRINYPTRWILDNGISLCKACHYALHNRDTGLMTKLCEDVKGPEVMERLRKLNQGITKAPTKSERVEIYAALKKERDALRKAA